jgi:hypothetical protein
VFLGATQNKTLKIYAKQLRATEYSECKTMTFPENKSWSGLCRENSKRNFNILGFGALFSSTNPNLTQVF